MRHRPLAPAAAVIVAAMLAVAGCGASGSGTGPWTPPPGYGLPSGATATPSERVSINLTDAFRVEPGDMSIKVGTTVTFVVTNSGKLEHEIFIGPQADQDLHETEMLAQGAMVHDHDNGIGVHPGQTRELTHTFSTSGTVFAGCHVPGHYGAGMYMRITVTA